MKSITPTAIKTGYHSTPLMKAIRIFLLVLIIIGICLLITRNMWVPKLVEHIVSKENGYQIINPIIPQPPEVRAGKIDTGVEGIVTIGPTCPVVRYPDDGTCANRPYQTTLIIASDLKGKGGGILVRTDKNGYFSHELMPGNYTISAQSQTSMPRLAPVTFEVKLHTRVALNLIFDSGIR